MNDRRRIFSVLFSLFLTLGSLPAEAVSFIGAFDEDRFNARGTDSKEMTPRNTTFCYLSKVTFDNTDTEDEQATCRVRRGTFVWFLDAILDQNDDADVQCSAICFNN